MTDHSLPPQFVDDEPVRPIAMPRAVDAPARAAKPAERSRGFFGTLDKPTLLIIGVLLAIGIMMVYSTTFDWSFADFGSPTVKVIEHIRNVLIGIGLAAFVVLFDYRRVRRLAVPILLASIASLIAVLLFGDDVFNARRSLIAGRFQPGELAELAMVVYMAAWLGSKNTRVRSLTYGLIPFAVLVGIVCGLVVLQPDLSTAIIIGITCGLMFFLAGADVVQLAVGAALAVGAGAIAVTTGALPLYAQGRVTSFLASWTDITQADYHVRQAYVAFDNGGWFGVGLGEGAQKFTGLPAPHTDSIFAVIGEELGILGAVLVVVLFILLVARGFAIARRAGDPFGALLAAGVTVWIVSKAMLNIAVMLALVPPTGVVLPFISFGGSSMVTLLIGVGLLISVQRVNLMRQTASERRPDSANIDRRRRNGGTRVSRAGRGRGDSRPGSVQ
jgi:cell division protein FtsW